MSAASGHNAQNRVSGPLIQGEIAMQQGKASLPVIKRLPKYYRYLTQMQLKGISKVSSSELARIMGTTASQVRQDFNCFGGFGQQGIGYNVDVLLTDHPDRCRPSGQCGVQLPDQGCERL